MAPLLDTPHSKLQYHPYLQPRGKTNIELKLCFRWFQSHKGLTARRCFFQLLFHSQRFRLTKCNVRQSALQKFLKISIKNSKCATSNKHIQDGRPGRYKNRRGSKKKAKHHQKRPNPPPRNENVRDVITQKA